MAAVRPPPYSFFLLSCFLFTHLISSLAADADALLELKKSLVDVQNLSSWAPNTAPCKAEKALWHGVVCDENSNVEALRLADMGLSGMIDMDALEQMKGLRSISLDSNGFSGPIPEFKRIGSLKAIYLSGNQFSGIIPSDCFAGMKSLKKVWLSNNQFTGDVPSSLFLETSLIELHLENNQFSGQLLEINSKLLSFNISSNKLSGEIPKSYGQFNSSSFQGNDALCGSNIGKECGGKGSKLVVASVMLGLVVAMLAVASVVVMRRRKEDFGVLEKDSYDEPPEKYIRSDTKDLESGWKRTGSSTKGSQKGSQHGRGSSVAKGCSRKSSQSGRSNGMEDLEVVNDEKGIFGLPDLMKAAAEVLGNGGLGSAYKAVMANGVAVVVKRMRDMHKLGKDEFAQEMRRLGGLRHRNILAPLAYHYRKEEKLMVSEYIPKGSLLYLLHGDRGPSHADLDWAARLKIVKGIARGLDFLHTELSSYEIPHGNLKSSNIFLGSQYEPLLSDYGFSEFVNPTQAAQTMFAYKAPEYMFYQQVSPKCDVYCFGIVILEILTGKFPCQYLNTGKGGTDVVQWVVTAISEKRAAECFDPEITGGSKSSIGEMEKLLHIAVACVEQDASRRLSMKEAIKKIEDVQTHGSPDLKGISAVPTLKDGYADESASSRSHTANVLEGYGELSGRRDGQESFGERRNGDSFIFNMS